MGTSRWSLNVFITFLVQIRLIKSSLSIGKQSFVFLIFFFFFIAFGINKWLLRFVLIKSHNYWAYCSNYFAWRHSQVFWCFVWVSRDQFILIDESQNSSDDDDGNTVIAIWGQMVFFSVLKLLRLFRILWFVRNSDLLLKASRIFCAFHCGWLEGVFVFLKLQFSLIGSLIGS